MKKYTDAYGLCPKDRKSKWFMQTDVRGIAKQTEWKKEQERREGTKTYREKRKK